MSFIKTHNEAPAPYIWTRSASDILEKVKRGREKLNKLQTVWRPTLANLRGFYYSYGENNLNPCIKSKSAFTAKTKETGMFE